MHPLLSTIHPNLRTTLWAWLVGRATLWAILWTRGGWPWSKLSVDDATHTVGWSLLTRLCLALDAFFPPLKSIAPSLLTMTALGEVMMLFAVGSVYHLSRRDTLPQTAERTTWLWALCPLWVLVPTTSSWTFGIGSALLAMALVERARYGAAMLMMAIAVSMRIDMVLIAPIFAVLAFKAYAPGRAHPAAPWASALGAHALLPTSIFAAMFLGGRLGVSLRTLHPYALIHLPATNTPLLGTWIIPLVVAACCALACLFLAFLHRRQSPSFWLWVLIPAALWPVCFASPHLLMPILLVAFPLFALWSKSLDNPSHERVALLVSVLGSVVLSQVI